MIEQSDREAAAKALGYASYDDATDYRNTGAQDRAVAAMVQAFAAHRHAAQGTEARRDETGTGSAVGDGPVR